MILEWIGIGFVFLTLVGCALLALVVAGLLYQLALHLVLRKSALAREERLLAAPLSPDDELPHVVVQIPVYNEGALVERAIAGAVRLDWPRDKLHIQVCDDSTDGTTELARAAVQRVRDAGIDAVVVRRPHRRGFKASSLQNAMDQTAHEYFAIFDVDFVPPPEFLRRCMAALFADPNLAFVQARIDYLNANESVLTRAQTILLDYHHGFEQATRSWSNSFLPFNGTCGIWRRAAIEAGGGWHGDTLLEDWDLSARAWMAGWRGIFLVSVSAPGELPSEWRVWIAQQRRWGSGFQVAQKALAALRRNRGQAAALNWSALLPLASWFQYASFSATLMAAVPALLLLPSSAWLLGLVVYFVFASAAVGLFAVMLVARQTVGRDSSIAQFVCDFPLVLILCLYISWANLRAIPSALLRRRADFERTPKKGSVAIP